jgi:hypothetical protein
MCADEHSPSVSGEDISVLEERGGLIFTGQLRCLVQLPVDGQVRIVPANAAFSRRRVPCVEGGLRIGPGSGDISA